MVSNIVPRNRRHLQTLDAEFITICSESVAASRSSVILMHLMMVITTNIGNKLSNKTIC